MPQFDLHRNKGGTRDSIPYVVVVQSTLFDNYRRRVVVPLVKASAVGTIANPRFNPTFKIGNTTVVLHPLETVSVAVDVISQMRPKSWLVCCRPKADASVLSTTQSLRHQRNGSYAGAQ